MTRPDGNHIRALEMKRYQNFFTIPILMPIPTKTLDSDTILDIHSDSLSKFTKILIEDNMCCYSQPMISQRCFQCSLTKDSVKRLKLVLREVSH